LAGSRLPRTRVNPRLQPTIGGVKIGAAFLFHVKQLAAIVTEFLKENRVVIVILLVALVMILIGVWNP
jgi:UDP-N-acetylmuramyl pentapeptide phosphotransferase/UDP-N-acetylglucosamine-1-phosphate transferase